MRKFSDYVNGMETSVAIAVGSRVGVLSKSQPSRFKVLVNELRAAVAGIEADGECFGVDIFDKDADVCVDIDGFAAINTVIDYLFSNGFVKSQLAMKLFTLNCESIYFLVGCCQGCCDLSELTNRACVSGEDPLH